MKLKQDLQTIIDSLSIGILSENDGYDLLTELLYSKHKDNMLPLFLQIQQMSIDEHKREKQLLYSGLEESMSNVASLIDKSTNKTARKFNDEIKWITETEARMIRSAIAYFPKGIPAGSSASGQLYLKTVVNLILKNKAKYTEKGWEKDWAKHNGYLDWIENILKIYNDDGTLKTELLKE